MTQSTPPRRETRRIDGLHVTLVGPWDAPSDRPVLLLGHGLLMDGRMWDAQVDALGRELRLAVLDFRGHGESAPPPRGFRMQDQAEDYGTVLDALQVPSAVLVGFSMGGMAALHFAAAHPGRVRGLVLIDTSADPEAPRARAKYQALAWMARAFGIRPFLQRQVAAIQFGETFRREQPDVVATWMARWAERDRTAVLRAVQMVISRPPATRLTDLACPTLVIVGDEDVATPPVQAQRIVELVPAAELRLIPRAGHLSPIEAPHVVTGFLRAFANKLAPSHAPPHG